VGARSNDEMAYPVTVTIEPQLTRRDRFTTFFRLILALPHFILVGAAGSFALSVQSPRISVVSQGGLIGIVVSVLAVVSWFTILLSRQHVEGIREFTRFFLRWRLRVMAYSTLLVDQYPPFGDGPYPAALHIADPAGVRDRLTVALRIILVIPHVVVLFFVMCVAWVLTVFAWFAILITGDYPRAIAPLTAGALRWAMRVEAYLFLMVDEYPPFGLE
jgi:hypothetical protein